MHCNNTFNCLQTKAKFSSGGVYVIVKMWCVWTHSITKISMATVLLKQSIIEATAYNRHNDNEFENMIIRVASTITYSESKLFQVLEDQIWLIVISSLPDSDLRKFSTQKSAKLTYLQIHRVFYISVKPSVQLMNS
jgi:hypothetical protein